MFIRPTEGTESPPYFTPSCSTGASNALLDIGTPVIVSREQLCAAAEIVDECYFGTASGRRHSRALETCSLLPETDGDVGLLPYSASLSSPGFSPTEGLSSSSGVVHSSLFKTESAFTIGSGAGVREGRGLGRARTCPDLPTLHLAAARSAEPSKFKQLTHLHLPPHVMPSWKHSQYFLRHALFLQLQPTA